MNLEPRPLPAYTRIDRTGKSAEIHPDFAAYLTPRMMDDRLFARGSGPTPAAQFEMETPLGSVILRPSLRGGTRGFPARGRHLFGGAIYREFIVCREAYERGVSTPLPVGVLWKRSGLFVTGFVATQSVEAPSLYESIRSGTAAPESLAACGRAICSLHAAGFVHGALSLYTLLARGGEGWVVGIEHARPVSDVGRVSARADFMDLRRSCLGNGGMLYFDAIRDGYVAAGGTEIPL